jgi:hypothetical protein
LDLKKLINYKIVSSCIQNKEADLEGKGAAAGGLAREEVEDAATAGG